MFLARANVITTTDLELLPRGNLYHDLSLREAHEFWEKRFDIFKYEFFNCVKGFVALDVTFDDPVAYCWLGNIFMVVMDSLWTHHIAPKLDEQWVQRAFPDQDFRELFKKAKPDRTSSKDFRNITKGYEDTKPTLANIHVFRGVLSLDKKMKSLRSRNVEVDVPLMGKDIYGPE